MAAIWTPEEIAALSKRFGVREGCRLHAGAEDFHFPRRSFLQGGYAPPGGYVKDFSVIWHEGRLHLFHIDGRPGEVCWITGNEISFGHASTSDLCRWVRHPMPLAVGERTWESEHIWAPYIYKHGELFCCFYMGSGGGETFISYATSTDLEKWTRRKQGPIRCAVGRDPFVFAHGEQMLLFYTGHGSGRIAACASKDLYLWEPRPDVLVVPGSIAVESPSIHPWRDKFVLWFNDYGPGMTGFRAAYIFSDDPFSFDADNIQRFEFHGATPGASPNPEFKTDRLVPVSIEVVARGAERWLVAYFRWQGDRCRLFFGELDWTTHPASIREISTPQQLADLLDPSQA